MKTQLQLVRDSSYEIGCRCNSQNTPERETLSRLLHAVDAMAGDRKTLRAIAKRSFNNGVQAGSVLCS